MSLAIVWFRRDFRLQDNPALSHAIQQGYSVLPLYIHNPHDEQDWRLGAASRWWLHHSLAALQQRLAEKRVPLLIAQSTDTLHTLYEFIQHTGATAVFWNRLYEPHLIHRDAHIKKMLRSEGVIVDSFNSALLNEPWIVKNQQDEPYKVFTPYWKACQILEPVARPLPEPEHIPTPDVSCVNTPLAELGLLPTIAWDSGLYQQWTVGEQGALNLLEKLQMDKVQDYHERRDYPATDGVSLLSPYLHFGEISPRQIYHALKCGENTKGCESYIRQLYWREFAYQLLYHFPHTSKEPLYTKYLEFPWNSPLDTDVLHAWQCGKTGFPIIDAGMRQLWATGWMHNRVRMLVASFLTKNALIHWNQGAHWFWDTLVDADLANNSLGWQWVAGCGADAAPYYRIFNPYTQSEKFDPQGHYIRRWLPELTSLDSKEIHNPPAAQAKRCGYPTAILDFAKTRDAALVAYEKVKK